MKFLPEIGSQHKEEITKNLKKKLSKAGRRTIRDDCQKIIKTQDYNSVVTHTPATAKQKARQKTKFRIEQNKANKVIATVYQKIGA